MSDFRFGDPAEHDVAAEATRAERLDDLYGMIGTMATIARDVRCDAVHLFLVMAADEARDALREERRQAAVGRS